MSFDRHIDQVCTHRVVDEAVLLGDLQTLRPKYPLASEVSVRVRMNGLTQVPPGGVHSPALCKAKYQGPFSVAASQRLFQVRVNAGSLQSVYAPAGSQLPLRVLLDSLNRQLVGCQWENENGRPVLRSEDKGRSASLFLPVSPLSTLFGVQGNRSYRGKIVHPGWTLVVDPRLSVGRPYRYIVFDEPLLADGYGELTYVTRKEECRRCSGTGVEYDWRYTSQGNTGEVRQEALLLQEILKIFVTDQGSNPFHPAYGTTLMEKIGKKITNGRVVQAAVAADLSEAFRRWQNIKKRQEEVVGQFVSDEEFPYRILSLAVTQDSQDPTILYVETVIQNRSLNQVELNRGFKLPDGAVSGGLFRQSINRPVQLG